MKFITYLNDEAHPQPGVLVSGDTQVLNLNEATNGRISSILELIEGGDALLETVRTAIDNASEEQLLSFDGLKLKAPLRPIQLRSFSAYALHFERAFAAAKKHHFSWLKSLLFSMFGKVPPKGFFETPLYYKGTITNIAGPHDNIIRPPYGGMLDYELELAIIIGKSGKSIQPEEAHQHIFGYTVFNDVSAREQLLSEIGPSSGGPAKGKDFDNSNIIGPWIVTPDEIVDPMNLSGRVKVNGELRGESSTSFLSHSISQIIAYASKGETLYPGEMLATGAMPYGCGLEDWTFLDDGDEVELEIDGIGKLSNKVVSG